MNWLNVVVSALGLIAAVVLLVAVLKLRRVALGGAIADNLPLVILGALAMGLTVLCPPTRLVLKAHGLESLEMTLRDPNGVLLNFIQNLRGGIGPANRFPGIARKAVARKSRNATQKRAKNPVEITSKSSALKNKPKAAAEA